MRLAPIPRDLTLKKEREREEGKERRDKGSDMGKFTSPSLLLLPCVRGKWTGEHSGRNIWRCSQTITRS